MCLILKAYCSIGKGFKDFNVLVKKIQWPSKLDNSGGGAHIHMFEFTNRQNN